MSFFFFFLTEPFVWESRTDRVREGTSKWCTLWCNINPPTNHSYIRLVRHTNLTHYLSPKRIEEFLANQWSRPLTPIIIIYDVTYPVTLLIRFPRYISHMTFNDLCHRPCPQEENWDHSSVVKLGSQSYVYDDIGVTLASFEKEDLWRTYSFRSKRKGEDY